MRLLGKRPATSVEPAFYRRPLRGREKRRSRGAAGRTAKGPAGATMKSFSPRALWLMAGIITATPK